MALTANDVFRDFNTAGLPSSGAKKVAKSDAREWGTNLEALINAVANGGKIYQTKAAIDADGTPAINTSAIIVTDSTPANNGLYQKTAAPPTATWVKRSDFVPGFQFISAADAGAGTANAIIATSSLPIPATAGQVLVSLNIFRANTGSPVTVANNGGTPLTIKTSSGNDIAVGGLQPGMFVVGVIGAGNTFRLLSDQASAAIQAACEAAVTNATTQAGVATTQAGIATAQAVLAGQAAIAARAFVTAYTTALPRGVTSTTSIVGGSGGTNGTFALGVAGGSISNVYGTFTVSGGALTSINIPSDVAGGNDGRGLGTGTTPPTLSFSASAGLTGASATAVVGPLIATGNTYWAQAADGLSLVQYRNDGTSTPAATGVTLATATGVQTVGATALGVINTPGELDIQVIAGGVSADGPRQASIFQDFRDGWVYSYRFQATSALALHAPAVALGTNWVAFQFLDANGKFQIRTENRQTGAPGFTTTTGNNVDPILEGDNVRWRNTEAVGSSPSHLYAPASGVSLLTGGLIKAAVPGLRFWDIGDSLTGGSGAAVVGNNLIEPDASGLSRGSYPSRTAHLFGGPAYCRVFNDGYAGHTGQHMLSRMNGDDAPININVTGASVPSTGTVSVTSISPYPGVNGGGPMGGRGNSMTGWGVVSGVRQNVTLRSTVVSNVTSYTLEKTTPGGAALSWPNGTRFYRDLTDLDDRIVTWFAHRNVESVAQSDLDDSRVQACIRSLHKRFLAVTVTIKRDGSEDTGASYRVSTIDPINAAKSARWTSIANGGPLIDINAFFQRLSPFGNGSGAPTFTTRASSTAVVSNAGADFAPYTPASFPGYIVNANGTITFPDAFAIMGLSPSAQDITDMAAGRNPQTFMFTDNIHINDNGYEAFARLRYLVVTAKGWLI